MKQALAGLGVAVVLTAGFAPAQGQGPKPAGGVSLSDLSWPEAESVLTPSSVVIIPLGVATVQHGPHLKLNNNERSRATWPPVSRPPRLSSSPRPSRTTSIRRFWSIPGQPRSRRTPRAT